MNKLKFTKLGSLALFIAISSMVMISCTDDPEPVATDFTTLNASITEAETLIATTEEGLGDGQYVDGSQAILQTAIDLAEAVAGNSASSQTVADNANIALQAAITAYEASAIVPIDPANLSGHWQFNEGTGTIVTDFSGNGFDGEFMTGAQERGAGVPSWGTDRYGNENSALVVGEGAWVKVPYNAALNPAEITVSLWLNSTELPGGRFLGLQSWNGYKFEVPDHGKPFFTAATEDGIWDNDAGVAIVAAEWYHLAVTYGGGNMTFYIDGEEVAVIPRESSMVTVTGHDLAIGVDASKYAATPDNYDDDTHADYHVIPLAWGGFFTGSLDELRIYKAALTATQIMSIYTVEKP